MRAHYLGPLGASMTGLVLGLSLLATPALAQLPNANGYNYGTPAHQGGPSGAPSGGRPGGAPGGWHGGGGGGNPGQWHGGGGQANGGGGQWHGGGQPGYHGNGWHGGGGWHGGNNWGGGYNHGYGYNNGAWVAPAIGLGLLGGAIAGSVYANDDYGVEYDAPPVGGDATAYCLNRFKSYDPASGTYLGYDGLRHPCP